MDFVIISFSLFTLFYIYENKFYETHVMRKFVIKVINYNLDYSYPSPSLIHSQCIELK